MHLRSLNSNKYSGGYRTDSTPYFLRENEIDFKRKRKTIDCMLSLQKKIESQLAEHETRSNILRILHKKYYLLESFLFMNFRKKCSDIFLKQ